MRRAHRGLGTSARNSKRSGSSEGKPGHTGRSLDVDSFEDDAQRKVTDLGHLRDRKVSAAPRKKKGIPSEVRGRKKKTVRPSRSNERSATIGKSPPGSKRKPKTGNGR